MLFVLFLPINPLCKREVRKRNDFFNGILEQKKQKNFFCIKKVERKSTEVIASSVPCNVMDVNGDMHGVEKNSFLESSYQVKALYLIALKYLHLYFLNY